ncbi:MAG: MG2 domain-containing protein, partial [Mailhella sp.]|nr:MG2 domain-containing protein [Mailhella sp.]
MASLDSVRWSATRVRKPFLAMLGALDGTFAAPLENSSVDFDLLGEPAGTGTTGLPPSRSGKAQFAALDLSSVLSTAPSGAPRGLLQLKIDGMRKDEEACSLSRFILVTDLGLIVKKTLTGALDVFACSLSQGKPAAGVKISVLSRNGLPCAEAKTDAEGRTSLPSLAGMPPEKSPVAVIAEGAEGDLAWMPLNDYSRRADYSSFSVGGRSAGSEGLNAHVFSQRGVYRPGEMLHFGCILRRTDWNPIPAGMPLLAVLTDPSGKELFRRNFSSSAEGLAEFDWTSDENSRTGRYTLDIRIPGSRGSVIGTASVLVRDFMPETMRMKAEMVPASPRGWIYTGDGASPEVRAVLTDLYGAAGAGRRVTARLVTESAQLSSFAEWPGYTFCDPSEGTQHAEKDLPEVRTADDGSVTIPMPAGVAAASSAACMVELRGFEPDGGRSVTASASAVLSPRKALVGYRPDGSVPRADFIPQGRHAGMNIIAVGPDLRSTSLENLTLTVAERRFVSNLVSDSRGAFRYAETPVDKEISRTSASLPADGGPNWTIPTDLPGDFILKISDASGEVLATAPFTVVGERLRGSAETTDAGIRLHLAKTEYRAGETVEMSMTVPYDGAGLITIERDGVYAHRWFSAKAGDTVQSIAIPASFEGRGYVNVAFARAAGSRDIYLTPFACAAAPFNVGTEGRDLGLRIEAPAKSLPGEPLKVRLTSRSAGKARVFAVDEGVLPPTRFALPDPLRHLLKDRALDVTTLQAFDLVMPDHGIMKSRIPGFGGGDALAAAAMAGMQNPFKRRGEPPVAWWSGIVDVSADGTELAIPLPDWCGTTSRIMAVGSSPSLAGSARAQTVVRGNIVITPQMPLAAAPGDVFEAAVAVSAPEDASGAVRVSMKADEALSIEGPAEFEIPAGTTKETIRTFRVRVNEKPGDAGILFTAVDAGGRTVERRGSMSVRPASAKASGLTAGIATGPLAVSTPRDLIPYGAQTTLSVSTLPVPAVRGLAAFLDGWSYGCTEQLISKAFPYALLRSR